jgi:hypothetical protein
MAKNNLGSEHTGLFTFLVCESALSSLVQEFNRKIAGEKGK